MFTFCKLSARSIDRKQRITHTKEERAKEDARAQKQPQSKAEYEQSKKQNDVCVKVLLWRCTHILCVLFCALLTLSLSLFLRGEKERRRHTSTFHARNTTHYLNKTSKSYHDRDVPMCFRCSEICKLVFISQKTKKYDDESGENHIHRPRRKNHRNEPNQRHPPNDRARFGRGNLRGVFKTHELRW